MPQRCNFMTWSNTGLCVTATRQLKKREPPNTHFFSYIILLLVDIIGACHIRRCRLRQIKGYLTSKKKLLLWKFSVFIYWFSNFTNASGLATAWIWSCLQGFWKAAWLFGKRRGGGGGGGGCELKEREGGKTKEAPSNKAQRMSLLDSLSRSPAAMASTLAT